MNNEQSYKLLTETLLKAIEPLAAIADAWEKDGLDESRPGDWGDTREKAASVEIVSGRGGSTLLTLEHAFIAQAIRDMAKAVQP